MHIHSESSKKTCTSRWCCTLGCGSADAGLFLIRLALAAVFLYYGLQKFSNLNGTVGSFGKLGFDPYWAYLVAAVETLGGLAMLLGFFTAWAGVALAVVMAFAIVLVTGKLGFAGSGYGFNLVLLLTSLGIAMTGPGKYAICRCCNCKEGAEANPQPR